MLEAIESEIQCEVAYIAELPKCVWEIIGLVLGLRPVGFRSAAVAGALTSSSYILMRFAAARKPLWKLCVDCDEGQLQAFLEGPEPVDLVPWKIYQLGRLEYSVQELCARSSLPS